ncbi:FkbM family methyltransferase [Candidatus Peregrinibacteria bacterium]|nr:FkbM family methyltransferase [Candidatus Peregrinibacteria bacterium]
MLREFRFEKHLLQLDLNSEADESVFREVFLDTDYLILNDVIKAASHGILDIGGHIGLFSLYARGLNERAPILAYEPESTNFAAFKEHVRLNSVAGVTLKNTAVAGSDGNAKLYVSADSHNHSLVQATAKTATVSAVSMQTIVEKHLAKAGVDFCDLVKMDCEGAEFEILRSMTPELFKKIGVFYLEYHEYADEPKEGEKGRIKGEDRNPRLLRDIFQKNGFKTKLTVSRHDKRFGFILAHR